MKALAALLLVLLLSGSALAAIGAGGGNPGGFNHLAFSSGFNVGSPAKPTIIGWRGR
jgi:hypothetical protein